MLLHDLRTITVLVKKARLIFVNHNKSILLRHAAVRTAIYEGYIITIIIIIDYIVIFPDFHPKLS